MVVINIAEFLDVEDEPFKGVKGSIVRLYMEDFLTYRKMEIRAGPHVNLILGLNGTGKSTIVCAICIGLAGKPAILGRATNLKAYIRRGTSSSIIEIELYNPNGKNCIIKRRIKEVPKGCISDWYLNGTKTSLERIEQLTKDLNIQLDNLCQFLPQDRIQEFAEMDSKHLLRSTEEVLGNGTLSASHTRLIDIHSIIIQNEATVKHTASNLRTEQQHNLSLETDVQTYHQREEIKKRMEDLENNIAWIKYIDAGAVFNTAQSELRELTVKKKQKESSLNPLKKAIENLETQSVKLGDHMQKIRQNNFAKWYSIQRTYDADKTAVASAVSDINVHLRQAEKTEEEKVRRHNLVLQKVSSYESDMAEFKANGEHDVEVLKNQLVEFENERTEIRRDIMDINFLDERDKAERVAMNHKITKAETELSRLDDLRVSRMKYLERHYPDVVKAVKYFEIPENRNQLKGRIHEPMILHICVTDLEYGKIAERHLGMSDMTAFFCENADDLEKVFELSKKLKIRISVIHHTLPARFVKSKSNFTPEFMQKFHFKKVLIDLLEAPEYYMSFVCRRFYPEDVPIGTAETDAISKDIINTTNLRTFYTNTQAYQVSVSLYTKQKCTTLSYIGGQDLRIFTSEINASEKTQLQSDIRTMKEDYQRLSDNISSRSDRLKNLERNTATILKKIEDCNTKIKFKNELERKIKTSKDAAEKLGKELIDLTGMRQKAKQDGYDRRLKKLAALEIIGSATHELCSNGLNNNVMRRQLTILQSRLSTKQNQFEDAKTQVDEENNQIKALNLRVKAAADTAEKLKKEAMKKSNMETPPQNIVDGLLDVAELERSYNSERGRLNDLADKDLGVVKQYEEKLKKIEELTKEKEELEARVLSLKNEMQILKDSWLGPLRELIGRVDQNFTRFFRTMQCDGKVILDETDDEVVKGGVGKYGIKIMVSFRKGEPLSELCGWKQSGGERAISTALYVLALQELTTVPFRVIDEINQGMDAKNEARFFNLLCSLASGKSSPQYFLLTPKMLPSVEYHDNVSFHFIMNGPHVADLFEDVGDTPTVDEDVDVGEPQFFEDLMESGLGEGPMIGGEEEMEQVDDEEEDEDDDEESESD